LSTKRCSRVILFTIIINIILFSNILYSQDYFEGKKRKDLEFKYKTRILKTTFKKIDTFKIKFLDSKYNLEEILREKLYTSIYLNQSKNLLISYDGTSFILPDTINSYDLTLKVVELIGDMYFGKSELENIDN
tara:strand:- start:785 stop:1183 length:399 start_codon:yes stop_codon:yes gene_type:complete